MPQDILTGEKDAVTFSFFPAFLQPLYGSRFIPLPRQ